MYTYIILGEGRESRLVSHHASHHTAHDAMQLASPSIQIALYIPYLGRKQHCSKCASCEFQWPMLSRYAASAATPYPWGFIHLDLDEWILGVGEMLLSEEPPSWLGILAKSSLVSEYVERACVRWRLHVFAINLEFFSPYLHSWILPCWSER